MKYPDEFARFELICAEFVNLSSGWVIRVTNQCHGMGVYDKHSNAHDPSLHRLLVKRTSTTSQKEWRPSIYAIISCSADNVFHPTLIGMAQTKTVLRLGILSRGYVL